MPFADVVVVAVVVVGLFVIDVLTLYLRDTTMLNFDCFDCFDSGLLLLLLW